MKKLNIMAYDPFPTEPPILKILEDLKIKNIFLPPAYGRCMKKQSTKKNIWKNIYQMDTIIIPALYVQKNGFRLGRGGGFYDHILSFYGLCKALFVGYSWQIREYLPTEKHDKRVSAIVTESQIINCYY